MGCASHKSSKLTLWHSLIILCFPLLYAPLKALSIFSFIYLFKDTLFPFIYFFSRISKSRHIKERVYFNSFCQLTCLSLGTGVPSPKLKGIHHLDINLQPPSKIVPIHFISSFFIASNFFFPVVLIKMSRPMPLPLNLFYPLLSSYSYFPFTKF